MKVTQTDGETRSKGQRQNLPQPAFYVLTSRVDITVTLFGLAVLLKKATLFFGGFFIFFGECV